MEIHIFSDIRNIHKNFSDLKKAKNLTLRVSPASEIKKITRIAPLGSLVYADLSSFEEKEIPRILKFLSRLTSYRYAIIDPDEITEDIAELFQNGASDYIGKKILKTGITRNRLFRTLNFRELEYETEVQKSSSTKYILSGSDWKNIMPGRIYTFCFMFVELDNTDEIKIFGMKQYNRVIGSFHSYLKELIEPLNGKIWIWNDFGGLILFPFNGKQCDAIETALMLMINRKLLSAEITQLDIMLSYRVVMHIGNTVYKTSGETSTIVSDSLNSIFHLGQKYAEPGNFYMTDDIFCLTPGGLTSCFIKAGEYEGRNIFRMRRVL